MITLKLNIAIIDHHQLLAQSLSDFLYKYDFINSVQTFSSPKEYFAATTVEPDIVISEIAIPGISGIDVLVQYKAAHKKAKLIILTSIVEIKTIRHALSKGVSGYLSKNASPEELAQALLKVNDGEQYIGENIRSSLLKDIKVSDVPSCTLSGQEKEMLWYVCQGNTIKEIAIKTELNESTVQTNYKRILKKFKLTRTADLIVFVIQHGVYNPPKK